MKTRHPIDNSGRDGSTVPASFWTVHNGDARQLNRLLEPFSTQASPLIDCTITSPPYGNLKNYDHPDQIGFGQPYDEYLTEMRRVFRAVYRHTKINGSLWVIADTYRSQSTHELQPLPFQLAAEAADAGWMLRETVIWEKDKTIPWSSGGRMRNAFEYVLLLVKSPAHKFNIDSLRDPTELTPWWVGWPERYNPHGAVPTNVWHFPTPVQGSWKTPAVAHACPLPPDLVERLIILSTDEGDVVFDPFAGTGTVVAEANRLGRRGVGIELNKSYVKAFTRYVVPEIAKRSRNDVLVVLDKERVARRDNLLKLRALKYPKILLQGLAKQRPDLPKPFAVAVQLVGHWQGALREGNGPLRVKVTVAVDDGKCDPDAVLHALKKIEEKPPASKFGVSAEIEVVAAADLPAALAPRKVLFLYTAGNTWETVGKVRVADMARLREAGVHVVRGRNYRYAPILSPIEVRIPRPD